MVTQLLQPNNRQQAGHCLQGKLIDLALRLRCRVSPALRLLQRQCQPFDLACQHLHRKGQARLLALLNDCLARTESPQLLARPSTPCLRTPVRPMNTCNRAGTEQMQTRVYPAATLEIVVIYLFTCLLCTSYVPAPLSNGMLITTFHSLHPALRSCLEQDMRSCAPSQPAQRPRAPRRPRAPLPTRALHRCQPRRGGSALRAVPAQPTGDAVSSMTGTWHTLLRVCAASLPASPKRSNTYVRILHYGSASSGNSKRAILWGQEYAHVGTLSSGGAELSD